MTRCAYLDCEAPGTVRRVHRSHADDPGRERGWCEKHARTVDALSLYRRWYGWSNPNRKPPTDRDLSRWVGCDRATWDAAMALVEEHRRRAAERPQVFVCSRTYRGRW